MKKILYSLLFSMCLFSACTTNFDDYNTNPNSPDWGTINPSSLLEQTLNGGSSDLLNQTRTLNGELMQYTVSGTSLNAYHRYAINNSIQSGSWNAMFKWAANADHMYKLADKAGEGKEYQNSKAIALTLKVLFASNATDIFGDIPYSEAFEARDGGIDKPVFDTQKDVYTALFRDLEIANDLYDVKSSIVRPEKDLMYGGDMAKWKKFTNSLHLRLLMRLSNRDAEMGVSQKLQEILGNPTKYPIFTSNADNATLFYSGVKPFANRYGDEVWGDKVDRKCAENIIEMMSPTSDPRIGRYFEKKSSDWKGQPSGEYLGEGDASGISYIKKATLGDPTSPYSFMKYDEVLFIVAEAAKRNMIPGGEALVKENYDKALRASIEWWYSIDTSLKQEEKDEMNNLIDEYINVKMPYDGTLGRLLDQKYIAMFWVGYEAWHDYRRTGYPTLRIGSETQNEHVLPTRYAYPMNTASTNPDNYRIAVERLKTLYKGSDNMRAPVWWSRQAAAIN